MAQRATLAISSRVRQAARVATLSVVLAAISLTTFASTADACHGWGVSRSCFAGAVRLEGISKADDIYFDYTWVYVSAYYYDSGNPNSWGNDYYLAYNDWFATAGRWTAGVAIAFDVRSYHSFEHGGSSYGIPQSVTYGQCFPSETRGC